jgi:predicted amidohydrolase
MSNHTQPFGIVCIQCNCEVTAKAPTPDASRRIIHRNLDRDIELLKFAVASAGNVKIAVFPEFFLTGWPMQESAEDFIRKSCCRIPGEETERLSEQARTFGIYIAANLYEYDDDWPGCWFNCSFIIDPQGEVVSRYRRIHSLFAVSPYDLLEAYLKKHGLEEIFPVVETPHGRIAAYPCGEILIPEIARGFVFNGAEILLHCMGGGIAENSVWDHLRFARAAENSVYLASACSGLFLGAPYGSHASEGGSTLFDYEGRVLRRANGAGETAIGATIDINALRHFRTHVVAGKMLTRLKPDLYRLIYDSIDISTPNSYLHQPPANQLEILQKARANLETLYENGLLHRPD